MSSLIELKNLLLLMSKEDIINILFDVCIKTKKPDDMNSLVILREILQTKTNFKLNICDDPQELIKYSRKNSDLSSLTQEQKHERKKAQMRLAYERSKAHSKIKKENNQNVKHKLLLRKKL